MKDKVCMSCKTSIDMDKDYCEFRQYKKKNKIQSKAFYHVNCFRDRILKSQEQSEALKFVMKTMEKVNEKMDLNSKEDTLIL